MGLVTVERRGGIAILTYTNPPLGVIGSAGAQEMLDAFRPLAADPAVRSLIVAGGLPDVFIRHYDLDELSDMSDATEGVPPPPPRPSERPGGRPRKGFHALVDEIFEAPKPVVAAINGYCMGGGLELSLACDLRIASPNVKAIGLPEVRAGIFPGAGGSTRLPRVVGEAKALEMILRGLTYDGTEAHRIGLVHELADDPLARALEIAAEWETRGAEGLAYAKRLTRAALDRPVWDGLFDERRSFSEVMRTESARKALRRGRAPAAFEAL